MKVVDSAVSLPLENTTMLLLWGSFENAEPVTVNVTSALPTAALVGEIEMFGLCSEDELIEAEPQLLMPAKGIEHPTNRAIVLNILSSLSNCLKRPSSCDGHRSGREPAKKPGIAGIVTVFAVQGPTIAPESFMSPTK